MSWFRHLSKEREIFLNLDNIAWVQRSVDTPLAAMVCFEKGEKHNLTGTEAKSLIQFLRGQFRPLPSTVSIDEGPVTGEDEWAALLIGAAEDA